MTTRHTPGPWTAYGRQVSGSHGEYPLGIMVADCNVTPERGEVECKSNARLIAAAPELLEAAKDMLEYFDMAYGEHGENNSPAVIALHEAISKAEGGE